MGGHKHASHLATTHDCHFLFTYHLILGGHVSKVTNIGTPSLYTTFLNVCASSNIPFNLLIAFCALAPFELPSLLEKPIQGFNYMSIEVEYNVIKCTPPDKQPYLCVWFVLLFHLIYDNFLLENAYDHRTHTNIPPPIF